MSKFKLSVLFIILAAFSTAAIAGDKSVKRVPAGAVAFHFVFDLSFPPPDAMVPPEFVGYIAFIEGVDGDLFAGPPSQDTAYFTVRVTSPLPPPIVSPEVGLPVPDPFLTAVVYPPGGQFTVYFNSSPGLRDWNSPADFSDGVPIAVFEESALLSTGATGTFDVFPGVFFNTFSSKLIDSTPIRFNGQKINFKKLVPNGVTATNFGNFIRLTDNVGTSGGGTAIAIGGKPKWQSDDDSDD
ncbi:MAG: hypothetical protein KJP16_03500 [Gammaproteobacteria bacterium]|nr:hypothetical protein [Gammaproteobacteria bacterium]NNL49859.1 hypothetical protein [Woeseiaceae bacterium]